VLDPFAGTGTTGEAAFREGFNAVLIERETEYQADIRRRMGLVLSGPDERSRESIKARTAGQPMERAHGINAGHAWLRAADAMVVYTDRGISDGMRAGINTATFNRIPIEYRVLPDAQEPAENAANVVLETNAAFVRSEP
jgi:hypothetical protein